MQRVGAEGGDAGVFLRLPDEPVNTLILFCLYDALSREEFVTLIGILKKSKRLQNRQRSQRGKAKRKR